MKEFVCYDQACQLNLSDVVILKYVVIEPCQRCAQLVVCSTHSTYLALMILVAKLI